MVPKATVDAEASKLVAVPAWPAVAVRPAVMAMASGVLAAGIGVDAEVLAVVVGVAWFAVELGTEAVVPSGVMAIPSGLLPTGIGAPAVLLAVVMGVTVFEPKL